MLSSQQLIIWVDICNFVIYNTANAWSHLLESIADWQTQISNASCWLAHKSKENILKGQRNAVSNKVSDQQSWCRKARAESAALCRWNVGPCTQQTKGQQGLGSSKVGPRGHFKSGNSTEKKAQSEESISSGRTEELFVTLGFQSTFGAAIQPVVKQH